MVCTKCVTGGADSCPNGEKHDKVYVQDLRGNEHLRPLNYLKSKVLRDIPCTPAYKCYTIAKKRLIAPVHVRNPERARHSQYIRAGLHPPIIETSILKYNPVQRSRDFDNIYYQNPRDISTNNN